MKYIKRIWFFVFRKKYESTIFDFQSSLYKGNIIEIDYSSDIKSYKIIKLHGNHVFTYRRYE